MCLSLEGAISYELSFSNGKFEYYNKILYFCSN